MRGGSSSGGSTVGEALQILDTFDLESMSETQVLEVLSELHKEEKST